MILLKIFFVKNYFSQENIGVFLDFSKSVQITIVLHSSQENIMQTCIKPQPLNPLSSRVECISLQSRTTGSLKLEPGLN